MTHWGNDVGCSLLAANKCDEPRPSNTNDKALLIQSVVDPSAACMAAAAPSAARAASAAPHPPPRKILAKLPEDVTQEQREDEDQQQEGDALFIGPHYGVDDGDP